VGGHSAIRPALRGVPAALNLTWFRAHSAFYSSSPDDLDLHLQFHALFVEYLLFGIVGQGQDVPRPGFSQVHDKVGMLLPRSVPPVDGFLLNLPLQSSSSPPPHPGRVPEYGPGASAGARGCLGDLFWRISSHRNRSPGRFPDGKSEFSPQDDHPFFSPEPGRKS